MYCLPDETGTRIEMLIMNAPREAIVAISAAEVHFGAVRALNGVDLAIPPGECIGLVGHNGAGKSTIVNVINGGLSPHQGGISYNGAAAGRTSINLARSHGIRCVFQELSLCANLTIVENARIMHRALAGPGWRSRAQLVMHTTLADIFPGHRIDCSATVADLSIAERQMVEIAIAFAVVGPAPKLVILDEPTSSLDAGLAAQLMAYVRRYVESGGSVLLISHILGEILSTADRIVVMKDGKVVADRPAADFSTQSLVQAMGSVVKEQARAGGAGQAQGTAVVLELPADGEGGIAFRAHGSEIIGLAGLGGHGQTDMLLDLFARRSNNWLPARAEAVAFVAGDRSLNGTFSLWSILQNLTIASLARLSTAGLIDRRREADLAAEWKTQMEIRTPDMAGNGILSLSGGNQQKVLFARALATQAAIVLMDDPMRGVDIGTKQEVYGILRAEKARGRTFIWYSTEMDEICLCDRVYVFRDGRIVAELAGADVSEDNVLSASFSEAAA